MNRIYVLSFMACLLIANFAYAEDTQNYNEAELIKLRIKELELKKEILELENVKQNNTIAPLTSQANTSPSNANYSNYSRSSYYIRGSRGGCYTINKSGNKRYVDRSLCD